MIPTNFKELSVHQLYLISGIKLKNKEKYFN